MFTPLFTQHYPRGSGAFNALVDYDVQQAIAEDIGSGDLTASLIPADKQALATIITREDAVICGIDWVNACFKQIDTDIKIKWLVNEGEKITANQLLCEINGSARGLLTAERCALNFLQLLSAVATETRKFVMAVSGTKAQILDTRKTIPGLRLAQKYAVTVGGGANQRLALYDGILIKENHIAAAGSVNAAVTQAITQHPNISIQIEVENTEQLKQALDAGAISILLDNFGLKEMKEAVEINKATNSGRAKLEASGGVDLSSARATALTGVDRISIGGLTKNIRAVDLSLRIK
ncbi:MULTISPECIES: carboxylating nicotinate-nucleotide diphosphorylase [Methylotenera]|uniref:carboxylating nicotinate-nucleotide diphosphorylase n=1 Tax=Methylotenera TaxID=359407 RepID=UPI00037F20F1|nr:MULTISPECIES: carboxylating nicotinate-nucleotide diphosphorylase [Methylotenera]